MKKSISLRLKLTLASVAVLILALAVCCILITNASRTLLENAAMTDTASEALSLRAQFSKALEASGAAGNIPVARYLFGAAAVQARSGSSYVLEMGGTPLFNNSGVSPASVFARGSESVTLGQQEFTVGFYRADGLHYCIAGAPLAGLGAEFSVCVVRDITPQMAQVTRLRRYCAAIGAAAAAIAGGLMLLFLTLELRPLKQLQQGAAAIAQGAYNRRVPCGRGDEIGLVARSFNTMAQSVQAHIEAVESAAQEQKLLLHALSHEMRTPVTAISGYAYALTHMRMSKEQAADALTFLDDESRRLERLYTKLTELITVADSKITLAPVSPEPLQAQLLALLSPLAQKQDIQLCIQLGHSPFLGDADLLTMFVSNLFDNARKAGARHFRLTLDGAVLCAADDGCGIPAEIQDKIMQPFYQGDSSRNHEGFGLGLSLCSRIARLHGSQLHVHSEAGQGAAFTICLQLYDDSKTPGVVPLEHHRKE